MHLPTVSVVFTSLLAAVSARPPSAGHPHKLPPCKPGHYWPDHHDCHSFFECDAGHQPVRKTCGPGTAYVWETGVCHHEAEVPSCHHGHGHPGHGPPGPQGPPKGPPAGKGHGGGPPGGKGHGGPPGGGHHGGPPAGQGPPGGMGHAGGHGPPGGR